MSIEWILYIIGVIEGINTFLTVSIFCCMFLLAFALIIVFISGGDILSKECEELGNPFKKWVKRIGIYFFISFFFGIIFPSEKIIYMIIGAHITKESHIPQKLITLINNKLDKYIEESIDKVKK